MLSLLYAYLCVPRRFRFILRWLAACAFMVVLVMILMLFWHVFQTLPEHHGWILHQRAHQPMSPDFIRYDLSQQYRPIKEGL